MLNYLKVSGGLSFYRGLNSLLSAPPFIIFNIKSVSMIVMLCYVMLCMLMVIIKTYLMLSYLICFGARREN